MKPIDPDIDVHPPGSIWWATVCMYGLDGSLYDARVEPVMASRNPCLVNGGVKHVWEIIGVHPPRRQPPGSGYWAVVEVLAPCDMPPRVAEEAIRLALLGGVINMQGIGRDG